MQNRYVGDIGDFAKYGLLRAIGKGRKLGVAWYLHPCSGPSGDGRHTQYLRRPDEWRRLDSELFEELRNIVDLNQRSVAAVQERRILRDAVFADEELRIEDVRNHCRERWRQQWFKRVLKKLSRCDLVFADPDNGIVSDENFKPTRKSSAKSISVCEAKAISDGRASVVYHHNTRRKGGHGKEIRHWMSELPGCTSAWHWRRWSCRTFFVIDPDGIVECQLDDFAKRWKECGELIRR